MSYQYSTIKHINEMSMNPMAVPLIKVNYKDNDSNGKIDYYDMTI